MDMLIYVENNSPLLAKMRQMILVDDIVNIQLIKNRLWNGVHAMMAWYASLRNHQTIGVTMSDHAVKKFMQQASDLEHLAQNFSGSCAHAYQDPCARVRCEPLRKLQHNERVMGSLPTLLKYSLPFDVVLKGAVLGYVYALEQGECERQELLMHMQIQLRHMALEPQLYATLYDEMSQFINRIIAEKLSLQKFMQLDLQQALN